jgi:sterol desaturase/sphingolipid hydroxylase (fatty acid hydroxylase superfamily)
MHSQNQAHTQPLYQRLFTTEFNISEHYRPVATTVIVFFAITYSIAFLGLMQYVAYLGPGLGDNLSFAPFIGVFDHFYTNANGNWFYLPLLLFVSLTLVNLIFTAVIVVLGYSLYPRLMGKPFPITVLFTYLSLNAVCTIGIGSMHLITGIIAPLFGYHFIDGFQAFDQLLTKLTLWLQQIPTVIDLPAWLAFFVIMMAGGFFHYWFHRLAHESRVLWLLFHRTHHMTPELIQPSTQSVFNAFPFFVFAAVPYVLIFTVIGKLVTADSILMYLIIFKLISAFANLFSHQTALYRWAQKQLPIRILSTITSEGIYHYLHHSAEAKHNQSRGNLVNIGGGLFFFWDRCFGTYQTATDYMPRVGLHNIDPAQLSTNPLRLAFAGIAQLVYELRHCQSIKEAFFIVFGSSAYTPKISRDFVLKASS